MASEEVDVNEVEMVDEVHQRLDALISVLEEKGVLSREEIDQAFENQNQQ